MATRQTDLNAPNALNALRELRLVLAAFAAFGVVFGTWQVLLVHLKLALALSDAQLGAAIAVGFVGAYPAMFFGGRLVDRYGAAAMIAGAGLIAMAAFALLAVVNGFVLLTVLLFCFFALAGAYDVGINTAGMHVEQRRGRRAMPLLHAGYSGGAAVGAIGTGTLLHLGVPFRPLFVLGAAVPAVVAALVFVRRRLFVGAHPAAHPIEPPGAEPQGARRSDTVHRSVPQAARPFRSPTIWLLALITGLCFFGEGSVETWSALYLSQVLGAAVLIGAAGPAVFHTAMFVGRLLSAATVARFGPYATLRGAGVLCAAGMALALGTDSIVATLAGFLVTGLALAAIAPQAFSIAGDHAGGRGGEASSLITMVGYGGFLFGPALIGGLSEAFGLRIALAALIAAGAGIGVLAFALHGAVRPAVRAAAE